MKVDDISIAAIKSMFAYNRRTGAITRRLDGSNGVFFKGRNAYVSYKSTNVMAARAIYMIVYGQHPVGLRTRYRDGDTGNLRFSNLDFRVSTTDAPGKPRVLAQILAAMEQLGGQASTPMIRAAAGLGSTVTLAAYMKVLEQRGKAHVCGIDARHTAATGRQTFMWALGPGSGRPGEARAVTHEMVRRRKTVKVLDEADQMRRRARANVAAAKSGVIANSVFAMAARLI